VSENDTLFQIDKKIYELAVQSAEANIEKATQQMGFEGAGVKSAAGRLGVAKAQLDRAQRNYDRVKTVFIDNPEALSLYDRDGAETALASSIEQVASAEADLEKAKQQLGNFGPDNANLKLALSNLESAKLSVYYTTLKAPTKGIIESFNLEKGFYCAAGQPMATFISTSDVWIRADFPENSMENIHINDDVDIILDIAPGRIFKGKVRSIGYGVSSEHSMNRGQLPSIQSKKGWLRPPQRFPVIISFSDEELMEHFKLGGQVDVAVYTGSYPILNAITNFRIWFNSKISYVR
jgi:multidrug resistance efflux pump